MVKQGEKSGQAGGKEWSSRRKRMVKQGEKSIQAEGKEWSSRRKRMVKQGEKSVQAEGKEWLSRRKRMVKQGEENGQTGEKKGREKRRVNQREKKGYFPKKGFVDPPPALPLVSKMSKKNVFPFLDNKINLTPKKQFIFNRAGRVDRGRSAGPHILAAAQGRNVT